VTHADDGMNLTTENRAKKRNLRRKQHHENLLAPDCKMEKRTFGEEVTLR